MFADLGHFTSASIICTVRSTRFAHVNILYYFIERDFTVIVITLTMVHGDG